MKFPNLMPFTQHPAQDTDIYKKDHFNVESV